MCADAILDTLEPTVVFSANVMVTPSVPDRSQISWMSALIA